VHFPLDADVEAIRVSVLPFPALPVPVFSNTTRPMKKKSSQSSKQNSMRPFSSILVDGPERAAARAML